jgi:hypothetical protein
MTPRAIVSTFLKIVNQTTIQQILTRAVRGKSARVNGTTCHKASPHPAARNKTTSASSREKLVSAAGSVCSAMTLTAALVEIRPFAPMYL